MRQVLFHIGGRSKQTLLFPGPQRKSNGALRSHTEAGQDASGLHDHGAAGAIVGSAVAGDPAIQVRPGHYVARRRVATRNVRKNVVGVVVGVLEMHAAVDLEPHFAQLGEPRKLTVVLGAELQARKLRSFAHPIAIAFTMHQPALGARHLYPGRRAFLRQEGVELAPKTIALDSPLDRVRVEFRLLVFVQFGDIGIGQALEGRHIVVPGRRRPSHQHDFAGQLTAPVSEITLALHRSHDHRGGQWAVGGRRPGYGNSTKLKRARCDHSHLRGLDPPAAAEIESFGPDILQSPAPEFILRPALGFAHGRRIGHAAANLIREIRGGINELAMIEAYIGNAIDRTGFGRGRGRQRRYAKQNTCTRSGYSYQHCAPLKNLNIS